VAGAETVGDNSLEAVWQVVGATLVGVGAGWAGGRALRAGEEHGSTEPGPALLFTLVLALAVLGACGLLRVDGVLGVFVAGMAFNAVTTGTERGSAVPVDEAVNRFLVLPLFVLLGAALPWREWAELGWRGPALVLGVLLLRRLPVLLALRRPLRLSRADALYLGWFGPIGVSALFYLTLAAERLAVDPAVLAAGTLVVAASTLVHGVTGTLGLRLYRRSAVDTVSDTGRQPVAGRQTG
jgi:NhaP-type Na+/H+ or K+/H+ antiporter